MMHKLPNPVRLNPISLIVAYPTPKVMGIKLSFTYMEAYCFWKTDCKNIVKGIHASFDS